MKKLMSVLVLSFVLTFLVGCNTTTAEYSEAELFSSAKMLTDSIGFSNREENPFITTSRYFKVTKSSEIEFIVDVNGTEMIVQTPEPLNIEDNYIPKNIKETNNKIISSSKKLVYNYIENSNILKDKDLLKNYITSIPVMSATFTEDTNIGAFFSHEDNTIYINIENLQNISEWMIVHEYIHAICYFTHNFDITSEEYAFNTFNEIITDIITSTINPTINENAASGYYKYYEYVFPYIHLTGENFIKAYFYGYDNIYNQIPKEELDFFVVILENLFEENSDVYYNNLMYKWFKSVNNKPQD